jgi:hypothetical protein
MPLERELWEGGLKCRSTSQETCHRVVRPEAGKSSQRAGRSGLFWCLSSETTSKRLGRPLGHECKGPIVVIKARLFQRAARRLEGLTPC